MRPTRIEPGAGQESVWDYPRPPRLEQSSEHVVVRCGEIVLADSRRSVRVLETSQPPAYYLPVDDVAVDLLTPALGRSFCEWKGEASYFDVVATGVRIDQAVWSYPTPTPPFAPIAGHLAFYAQRLDCSLDGEQVVSNDGTFYGGWITSKVVGPFKGGAGSLWW